MTTLQSDATNQPRRRQKTTLDASDEANEMSKVTATSLESIQILPRTPRTPRFVRSGGQSSIIEDEVELSLLDEEQRREAANGLVEEDERPLKQPSASKDRGAILLLIILYLIQGFPLGLALGSIPFILREHLSYSQLAIFSLASYPYSLKLLWSPIVDAIYIPSFGRRKSWIVPMQLIIGTIMLAISFRAKELMENPADHIYELTAAFTGLVLFSATQDIAVDGWALTLLSEENLPYASTCQTIGLNTGYLVSYTLFLALNSPAFSEKWGVPRLTLSVYLQFCSTLSFLVTVWLLFVKEGKESTDDISIKSVYKDMWTVMKLKHVQTLLIVHLFAKIGFQANEAVTQLKMVEKGLGREDLAIAVLIDFPFEVLGGVIAVLALTATMLVYYFPKPPITTAFFLLLIVQIVVQSFASTIQFGGMSAFHSRISDPVVGGTYMTLLNTLSNLGGTWPRFFVLKGVDYFSVATCQIGDQLSVKAAECVSDHGKASCAELGGQCVTERDGYYIVSAICMTLGLLSLIFYMMPTGRRLQAIPTSKWRVYS